MPHTFPTQRFRSTGYSPAAVVRASIYRAPPPGKAQFARRKGVVSTMKLYAYVGPAHLAKRIADHPSGAPISSPDDVLNWIRTTCQETASGEVIATYIVDESGVLMIADRRSEHVACAGGKRVQSAGEITFTASPPIEVQGVSNQSTGYCPEPDSWPAVAAALGRAHLNAPSGFELSCVFRKCRHCGNVTLVKDNLYDCDICGAELPTAYNVQLNTDG